MAAVRKFWLSFFLNKKKTREDSHFDLFVSLVVFVLPHVDTLSGTPCTDKMVKLKIT